MVVRGSIDFLAGEASFSGVQENITCKAWLRRAGKRGADAKRAWGGWNVLGTGSGRRDECLGFTRMDQYGANKGVQHCCTPTLDAEACEFGR